MKIAGFELSFCLLESEKDNFYLSLTTDAGIMKVVFVKKTLLLVVVASILIVIATSLNIVGLPVTATYLNIKTKLLPIYSVQTSENKLAISFDAAWGADKTREIMAICDSYNIKATFFLVGFCSVL